MSLQENLALNAFVQKIGEGLVFGQVRIQRAGKGWELRHVDDAGKSEFALQLKRTPELRGLAQNTPTGAYRPLKSAPNLSAGWRVVALAAEEIEFALHQLYPGALADWFAAKSETPPVSHYREFTNRQTGMYRITQMLSDEQAGQVARAHCAKRFCLKRRLWTVNGLQPDAPESKSVIPCLEPCPMLLEFARLAMRIEQEDKMKIELSASDLATIRASLEYTLDHPNPNLREADFGAPDNPRRIHLALEKLPKPTVESNSPA